MKLEIEYIFDSAESRVDGLMGKDVSEDGCALFVYDSPVIPKFWMKNVPYDLYLSSVVGGVCVESALMLANDETPVSLSDKTMFVVESKRPIPVGSDVDIVENYLEW